MARLGLPAAPYLFPQLGEVILAGGERSMALVRSRRTPGVPGLPRQGRALGSTTGPRGPRFRETDGDMVSHSNEIVAAANGQMAGLDDHIYNRLLKERIIFLGSEVRDDNANASCAQLLLRAAEDPEKDIWLYTNSPGGSVTAGMAVVDTMQ